MKIRNLALPLAVTAMMATADAIAVEPLVPDVPSGLYHEDPTHTSLTWRILHMGLSYYTARFASVDIELDFDAENPAASKVRATIDPMSVRTDYPLDNVNWDAQIATSPEMLNGGSYPAITFVSDKAELTAPDRANVIGRLSIGGVERPATLDVTFNGSLAKHRFAKTSAIGFSASTTIKRSNWGMDFLTGVDLADEVEILIEAELLRQ